MIKDHGLTVVTEVRGMMTVTARRTGGAQPSIIEVAQQDTINPSFVLPRHPTALGGYPNVGLLRSLV